MNLKGRLRLFFRNIYNKRNRRRLKNRSFSVISSNCNGGCMLHDLGMRFNSPFVNLWMKAGDFVKFLKRPDYYFGCDMTFTEEDGISYPIGVLDDIRLYFQHYKTPEEAKAKWLERASRINYDNLFVMMSERDGCTYDTLREFDALPYKNKVVFTHIPYPEIKSAYYISGWESADSIGICLNYKGKGSVKKYYDDFDYVSWFNGNGPD